VEQSLKGQRKICLHFVEKDGVSLQSLDEIYKFLTAKLVSGENLSAQEKEIQCFVVERVGISKSHIMSDVLNWILLEEEQKEIEGAIQDLLHQGGEGYGVDDSPDLEHEYDTEGAEYHEEDGDWSKLWDDASQCYYYYNATTFVSSWEPPEDTRFWQEAVDAYAWLDQEGEAAEVEGTTEGKAAEVEGTSLQIDKEAPPPGGQEVEEERKEETPGSPEDAEKGLEAIAIDVQQAVSCLTHSISTAEILPSAQAEAKDTFLQSEAKESETVRDSIEEKSADQVPANQPSEAKLDSERQEEKSVLPPQGKAESSPPLEQKSQAPLEEKKDDQPLDAQGETQPREEKTAPQEEKALAEQLEGENQTHQPLIDGTPAPSLDEKLQAGQKKSHMKDLPSLEPLPRSNSNVAPVKTTAQVNTELQRISEQHEAEQQKLNLILQMEKARQLKAAKEKNRERRRKKRNSPEKRKKKRPEAENTTSQEQGAKEDISSTDLAPKDAKPLSTEGGQQLNSPMQCEKSDVVAKDALKSPPSKPTPFQGLSRNPSGHLKGHIPRGLPPLSMMKSSDLHMKKKPPLPSMPLERQEPEAKANSEPSIHSSGMTSTLGDEECNRISVNPCTMRYLSNLVKTHADPPSREQEEEAMVLRVKPKGEVRDCTGDNESDEGF